MPSAQSKKRVVDDDFSSEDELLSVNINIKDEPKPSSKKIKVKEEPNIKKDQSKKSNAKTSKTVKQEKQDDDDEDTPISSCLPSQEEQLAQDQDAMEEELFFNNVYTTKKMGQTKPTPAPGQGDRVFYESLYNQKPNSFMALKWCIEYGVFDEEKAKKEFARLEEMKDIKKKVKEEKLNKIKKEATVTVKKEKK